MFLLDFKRMVYLFVLCTNLSPTLIIVSTPHVSSVNDVENFETYPCGIDLYKSF